MLHVYRYYLLFLDVEVLAEEVLGVGDVLLVEDVADDKAAPLFFQEGRYSRQHFFLVGETVEGLDAQNYVELLPLQLPGLVQLFSVALRVSIIIYPVIVEVVNVFMSGSAKLYLM